MSTNFDVVFIGTAPFGIPVLEELQSRSNADVVGVLSQPDREKGRGQEPQSPPVIDRARELGLKTFQPEDINEGGDEILSSFPDLDLAIVIAYGQILEPDIFNYPEQGTVNFHASLLPRWRGAAPIRHALLAGDKRTGVSVFRLTEGLDQGPVCVSESIDIKDDETYGELYERLSSLNVTVLDELLTDIQSNNLNCEPQSGSPTYAPRISSDDARIDWSEPAETIERHIRAFNPKPGAYSYINGDRLKIYRATIEEDHHFTKSVDDPGTIVEFTDESIIVRAGAGCLGLRKIQPSGSRSMSAGDYLRGNPAMDVGDQFTDECN